MGRELGEGIGKNPPGSSEPLLLDDKSGKRGKHDVSLLNELCAKNKWGIPTFDVLDESGPCHRKTFIMTVNVNGQQYASSRCLTKKLAKLEAAKACLEAIGKNPSGSSKPLLLDDKRGIRGIVTEGEFQRNLTKRFSKKVASLISSLEGKHQISLLNELCAKKKWGIPTFDVLDESGPSHRKIFIMTVNVNGQQYTSSRCQTKKLAKLEAAKECLKAIGVLK